MENDLAFLKRIRDTPYEAGEAFRGDMRVSLLSAEGEVQSDALNAFGIPFYRKADIQRVVDTSLQRTEQMLLNRMKPDPWLSREEKGIIGYDIPPDRDAGNELLAEMKADFVAVAGQEAAENLVKAMLASGRLGSYGRQGIFLQIRTRADSGVREVLSTCYDPVHKNLEGWRPVDLAGSSQSEVRGLARKVLELNP